MPKRVHADRDPRRGLDPGRAGGAHLGSHRAGREEEADLPDPADDHACAHGDRQLPGAAPTRPLDQGRFPAGDAGLAAGGGRQRYY